jgi:hypothetical protein
MTYVMLCPEFLDELEADPDCWRELLVLRVFGLAWTAWDMRDLNSGERTRRIELVLQLLLYNLAGEQIYLPFKAADGLPGVQSQYVNVFTAQSILAMLHNADARRQFRDAHPEAYKHLCERALTQNDLESLFSLVATSAGYKPGGANLLARLARINFADMVMRSTTRIFSMFEVPESLLVLLHTRARTHTRPHTHTYVCI